MSLYCEIAHQLKEAGFEMVKRGKGSRTVFNKKGFKRPVVVGWGINDYGRARQILQTAGLR